MIFGTIVLNLVYHVCLFKTVVRKLRIAKFLIKIVEVEEGKGGKIDSR